MSVTKHDLVEHIAQELHLHQREVRPVVQRTLNVIIETLEKHGRLELRNFGVFEVKIRDAKKARNPRTGEAVTVPRRKVVTFKAGKDMEERVTSQQHHDE